MIAFTHVKSEKKESRALTCGIRCRPILYSAVNKMCSAAAQHSRNPRYQKAPALPATHSTKANTIPTNQSHPLDFILSAIALVFLQVRYVVVRSSIFSLKDTLYTLKKPFVHTDHLHYPHAYDRPFSARPLNRVFKRAAPKISVKSRIGQLACKVMCEKPMIT